MVLIHLLIDRLWCHRALDSFGLTKPDRSTHESRTRAMTGLRDFRDRRSLFMDRCKWLPSASKGKAGVRPIRRNSP